MSHKKVIYCISIIKFVKIMLKCYIYPSFLTIYTLTVLNYKRMLILSVFEYTFKYRGYKIQNFVLAICIWYNVRP